MQNIFRQKNISSKVTLTEFLPPQYGEAVLNSVISILHKVVCEVPLFSENHFTEKLKYH